MALSPRAAASHQRLLVTGAANDGLLKAEAVGAPVEFVFGSREALIAPQRLEDDWATTGVYVLIGSPNQNLSAGDSIKKYDATLNRPPSDEPPGEPGVAEVFDDTDEIKHARAMFYTGLSRDLVRRIFQHGAKPWWDRALLCRQSPPWPYGSSDIGYLEGQLHEILDAAHWLNRSGRASKEEAIMPDREHDLQTGHLPAIAAAIRLLGVPLDTTEEVASCHASSGGSQRA